MPVTIEAIQHALSTSEETGQVEFKIQGPRDSELAERICGMANSRTGGMILLGVEDATGRVVGITKPQATADTAIRAVRLVKPNPPAVPEVVAWADQQIVVLPIPPNNGDLYQAGGVFWLRKGSQTFPMNRTEIEAHLHNTGTTRWERLPCRQMSLADLDTERVTAYVQGRIARRRSLADIPLPELLLGIECATQDAQTGEIAPTHAGMLLFGREPQLAIPHSELICVQYPDQLGLVRWTDRQICEGTLPEIIEAAATFLQRHTRAAARLTGFRRVDQPEYPLEALREAVVNAVAHRDYSRLGQAIRVAIFADRIEVISPGCLLPGITTQDLAAGRVASQPRNPLLVQLLRDLPGGYMERMGMGIRLMQQEMAQAGLPPPEFVEQQEVSVIFRNGAAAMSDITGQLNEHQLRAWQIVQERGSITTMEYVEATGAAERTALRELSAMVQLGLLQREGKRRAARYLRAFNSAT